MLTPEKLDSFDPKPKTLQTFLELLSELNSIVNFISDISDGAEGIEFHRLWCLNHQKCQENIGFCPVQKKMDLYPLWERAIDLLI